jgi:hypothetical protein
VMNALGVPAGEAALEAGPYVESPRRPRRRRSWQAVEGAIPSSP